MAIPESVRCNWSRDTGLLIIRLGLGIAMMLHGWPKITGGMALWGQLGLAMGNFGITFAPVAWGLAAACTEFFGGLLLAIGLCFRLSAFILVIQMTVATVFHVSAGDGFPVFSHALELGLVFLGLLFTGPGQYSLDSRYCRCRREAPVAGLDSKP